MYYRTYTTFNILEAKSTMGIELSSEDKLFLAGGRYSNDVEYLIQRDGLFSCEGMIDKEIGYAKMEEQARLMQEECDREYALSQGGAWTVDEMAAQRDQLTDTDWTPVENNVVPLPKWKVDSDKITKLLEAA